MQITTNKVSAGFMILVALILVWFKWPDSPESNRPAAEVSLPKPAVPEAPEAKPAEMAMSAISLPPPPPLEVSVPKPATASIQDKPVQEQKSRKITALKKQITAEKPPQAVAIKTLKKSEILPKPAAPKLRPLEKKPENTALEVKTKLQPIRKSSRKQQPQLVAEITPLQKSKPLKKPEPKTEPEVTPIQEPTPDYAKSEKNETQPNARKSFAETSQRLKKDNELEQDWRAKADQMVTVSARGTSKAGQEGRTLLRLLEHGTGPGISLTWPSGNGPQQKLFSIFNRCFGMVTAVMDSSGMLFIDQGSRGSPWQVSMDAYSGFVRQPTGSRIREEESRANRIRAYHGLRAQNSLVRVFPRSVDAVILGGLSRLIGSSYKTAGRINARYEMSGHRLEVRDIRVDGKTIPGVISVAPYQSCGGLA